MTQEPSRIIGRQLADTLSPEELEQVSGGGNWENVKFTTYDTNGGSDDTQLTDSR